MGNGRGVLKIRMVIGAVYIISRLEEINEASQPVLVNSLPGPNREGSGSYWNALSLGSKQPGTLWI